MQETIDDMTDAEIKKGIQDFFANKKMHFGGSISKKLLSSKKYISLCRDADISFGIKRCHALMSGVNDYIEENDLSDDEEIVREDTKLIISILNDIHRLKVPKALVGGLLIMYMELVLGLE